MAYFYRPERARHLYLWGMMAYFSNSSEGSVLQDQCDRCLFGEEVCPIYGAQLAYNYEACNNKTARGILGMIVREDGTCAMLDKFREHLEVDSRETDAFGLRKDP